MTVRIAPPAADAMTRALTAARASATIVERFPTAPILSARHAQCKRVALDDDRDLHHSVTSKLNIMPLSWCSAMWQ